MPAPRSSTLTKRLLYSMLKHCGFAALWAFLLRNCVGGARPKSTETVTGVAARNSHSRRTLHRSPRAGISVETPETLFPTLYDGAPKAVLIGTEFAGWFDSVRCQSPVRLLRATPTAGSGQFRLEDPLATSGGFGALRSLSVPPTN